jgi:CheY-like chemotaxis protein
MIVLKNQISIILTNKFLIVVCIILFMYFIFSVIKMGISRYKKWGNDKILKDIIKKNKDKIEEKSVSDFKNSHNLAEIKTVRILVVDDKDVNILNIQNIFTNHIDFELKFKIDYAYTGKQAIERVNKEKPDLIILDIQLDENEKEMSGFDVCKKLKSSEKYKSIPIIFVSGYADSKSIEVGLELGAVDYIIKPFNPDVLLSKVKKHLELQKAHEIIEKQKHELEIINNELAQKNLILEQQNNELERLYSLKIDENQYLKKLTSSLTDNLVAHLNIKERSEVNDYIKSYNKKGEIQKGIEELLKRIGKISPQKYNEVILLHSRLSQLDMEVRIGILNEEIKNTERNKIIKAILDITDLI